MNYNIHPDWNNFFETHNDELNNIFSSIDSHNLGLEKPYYPNKDDIFNAFKISPKDIKICLLGQDPYQNEGLAHGLSFSVPNGTKIPPSLINIFKEINTEYPNKYNFTHGNLELWSSREKIFLLNAALSVKPKLSNSHAKLWTNFTDDVIIYLSNNCPNIVFLLLGKFAGSKDLLIDEEKHIIIKGVHPSPLSVHKGFFNSNIFIKVDDALIGQNKSPVNWQN
jgi:uracil-DNA glycosylase